MRGCTITSLLVAGLVASGCYQSYPLTTEDDAVVTPDVTPDLPGEPDGPIPIVDSDGDCITDEDERTLGTDPYDRDTDGDGLTDWQEVASGTDPTTPGSGLNPMFVVLPFDTGLVEHRTVTKRTQLDVADVYFLIDTTGSMDSAIENVATSLASTIVPGIRARFPDVQMGVGHFNDMPFDMYGEPEDEPFWHVQDITDDVSLVQAALNTLYADPHPWGYGGDGPESNAVALWAAASGNGFTDCMAAVPRQDSCPAGTLGYPCFRPDVQPVIVHVSDATWHSDHMDLERYTCTEIDFDAALAQMNAIDAKHIGVFVGDWGTMGREAMREMSRETGAVDVSGEPLVTDAPYGSVDAGIIDMIGRFAEARYSDVWTVARDVPDDPPGADYDATEFVLDMVAVSGDPPAPEGYAYQDATTFYDVVPGTELTFDVTFRNDTVAPTDVAQFFSLQIRLVGDTVSLIDLVRFVIIVPPEACHP